MENVSRETISGCGRTHVRENPSFYKILLDTVTLNSCYCAWVKESLTSNVEEVVMFWRLSFLALFYTLFSVTAVWGQLSTIWLRTYYGHGGSINIPCDLEVDDDSNVYVTGSVSDGPGSDPGRDYGTIKYSPSGVELWNSKYGTQVKRDEAKALAVDDNGNVYVTGVSDDTLATFGSYATIKYSSDGTEEWVTRHDSLKCPGFGNVAVYVAKDIAVDGNGNVYVTGFTAESGSDCENYIDYTTIKYNSIADTLWTRRYNSPGDGADSATAIAVDGEGNVYVTGVSDGDYATIKYSSDGDQLWVARYDSTVDEARAITLDGNGDVYVTGYSQEIGIGSDYATIKYSSSDGHQVWEARYDGPGDSYDTAYALAVDDNGNVYVTGCSRSVGSGTGYDYATIQYSSSDGSQQSVTKYNGPGNGYDAAYAIAVDADGYVYVTGRSFDGVTGYTTIKYAPDADGDLLLDAWETHGYDHDGDGTADVDLPGMGANPLRKDIFVEIDWMEASADESESHKPMTEAIEIIIEAFNNGQVNNPDGSQGISLHVDYGQGEGLTGGNSVPHDSFLWLRQDAAPYWTEFDNIKNTNFATARWPIFHYCIFGHGLLSKDGTKRTTTGGKSRSRPGSDFVVTLGEWKENPGTKGQQAGTFMHELGHNLGLGHGGGPLDNVNFKPNYLSVMNYTFQTRGLYINSEEDKYYDYSRYDFDDLNKLHLNENDGIKGAPEGVGTHYYCPGDSKMPLVSAEDAINWNCADGIEPEDVVADINDGPDYVPLAKDSVLTGYHDWDNLMFVQMPVEGNTSPAGVSLAFQQEEEEELTYEQDQKLCINIPGDANGNGNLTLVDVISAFNYIFYKPGFPPCGSGNHLCWLSELICRGNWNGDGRINIVDVVWGVNYIFGKPQGGPWNPLPSGSCCLLAP
jgi:hypothetical protein